MENHVRLIAYLHIGLSILNILILFLIYFVLGLIGSCVSGPGGSIITVVANVLITFLAILSFPRFIGGIGLLRYREWARILIIIISFLNILSFPVGTAVGIYSIWGLVQKETCDLFHNAKNQTV